MGEIPAQIQKAGATRPFGGFQVTTVRCVALLWKGSVSYEAGQIPSRTRLEILPEWNIKNSLQASRTLTISLLSPARMLPKAVWVWLSQNEKKKNSQ